MKEQFMSENHKWETAIKLFNDLNSIFNFTLDCCAEHQTAKVKNYFTVEDNALIKDWVGSVWCSPPYGREQIKFVEKAILEHKKYDSTIVLLIPARTETKLWQDLIFPNAKNICFIRGRLRFSESKNSAPFPSALVVISSNRFDLSQFGWCLL